MGRVERINFFIACALLLFIPWALQLAQCPPDSVAMGYFYGGQDYFSFLVKTEYGRHGHWLYKNMLTPEPTEEVPIYFFYLFLGNLARWTGMSSVWAVQIARCLLGAYLLLKWWDICRRTRYPKSTFFVGIFLGFGLMASVKKFEYLEHFVQGKALLSGILGFPHYILDGIAFIWLVEAYLDEKPIKALPAGLLLGMVHPFLLALMPVVFALHSGYVKEKRVLAAKIALLEALGGCVFALPMLWAYLHVEWLREWRSQTGGFTWLDHLYMLTASMGLAGLLAWTRVLRPQGDLESVCAAWMVAAAVLVLAVPVANSREYAMFLCIPSAVLGVAQLGAVVERFQWKNVFVPALGLCTIFGVLTFGQAVFTRPEGTYVKMEFVKELKRLESRCGEDDVVICDPHVGILVPIFVQKPRPYVAHVCETLDAWQKRKEALEVLKNFSASHSSNFSQGRTLRSPPRKPTLSRVG